MGRSKAVEVLVWSVLVVVGEVLSEQPTQLVDILGAIEVDTLMLDVAPEAFDEGIVR